MINKLKSKIFLFMMVSLSIITIGIIVVSSVLNCTNAIKTTRRMKNQITGIRDEQFKKQNPEIDKFIEGENEKAETHVKIVIIIAVCASGISLIVIYYISKKLSEILVKPVEETLEKQKQFISDASHELKTPLTVIEANADVLENEIGQNKWLTYIQNETNSMDKLINELLLLAKIENVDEIKSYEKINLSSEIEAITSMFESMAYEKEVVITTKIQKDIYIDGNKQDIEHIVSTLLDNAIKHSEKQKEVTVELIKEKNNIIIQIKNFGEPISEDQKDKIFERFYRVDKARNRNEKRYGLGLAIAKATVEKYNGKIEVECKNGITNFKVII